MAYLLDTNHCIYLMNGWNNPKDKLSHQERNTVAAFSKIGNDKHMNNLPESFIRENWAGV